MYTRTTTASRRAEQKARERYLHVSVAYKQIDVKDEESGIVTQKIVVDRENSHGTYRKQV